MASRMHNGGMSIAPSVIPSALRPTRHGMPCTSVADSVPVAPSVPCAPAFSVADIRAAEEPLLHAERYPDQLMRSAAHHVAELAYLLLRTTRRAGRALLLVGPGGNGGDALYAGAELLSAGVGVEAVLLYPEKTHPRACEAFLAAGGIERPAEDLGETGEWGLVIDGLLGIGARGGLREEARRLVDVVEGSGATVLAVDVPSGIEADSGNAGGLHLRADVTITFGGLRRAHALCPECGEVILADPRLPESVGSEEAGASIGDHLREATPSMLLTRAWAGSDTLTEAELRSARGATLRHLPVLRGFPSQEPSAGADKYSGGVVGIAAGSTTYPGAAVLCTSGAVRATSSMVRYAGGPREAVLAAHPEIVASAGIDDAGRVQAWVCGPGRGMDETAAQELGALLSGAGQPGSEACPLLIDADGLTLLAEHAPLRRALRARTGADVSRETASGASGQPVVLTPHAGEFRRLSRAYAGDDPSGSSCPDPAEDPRAAVEALARWTGAIVLLKGRITLISDGERTYAIDSGSSWAATPGSGDVLAGVLGALIARAPREGVLDAVLSGVLLHARASALAAERAGGGLGSAAPVSAGQIAEAIPLAWAYRGSGAPGEEAAGDADAAAGWEAVEAGATSAS